MEHSKRRKKLSKEEIQRIREENLQEFGTDNRNEIRKMIRKLDIKNYMMRCKNLELYYGKRDRNRRWEIIHTIIHKHRIVVRQQHALFGCSPSEELVPAEKFLIELDNAILTKQLSQKKYNNEEIDVIIKNIRNKYSTVRYELQSIDVDDYTIDKDLNVTLLKTKDRYNNLPAEIKEQEVEVANRFEL